MPLGEAPSPDGGRAAALQTRLPWLAFGVCIATLMVRCYGRLMAPHLWAEDGLQFLPQALEARWASLTMPIAGYFHLYPRFLSQVGLLFPLPAWATFNCLAWIATFSFSASLFVRPAYRDLIPSDAARFGLAVGLCFTPGLQEVLGTLCNIHWALSMGLWFIALKPSTSALKPWELGVIAVAALSGGESIVTIPVFMWRAVEGWRRGAAAGRAWALDVVAFMILLGVAALNVSQRGEQPPVEPHEPVEFVSALRYTVLNYVVYQPWLGAKAAASLSHYANRNFFHLWGGLAIVAAAVVLVRRRLRSDLHLLLAVGTWLGVVVLTWLVRPGGLGWWDHQDVNVENFASRYGFELAFAPIVFWVALFRPGDPAQAPRRRRAVLAAALALIAANAALQLRSIGFIGPYAGQQGSWLEDARQLDAAIKAGVPRHVTIQIPPYNGWTMDYDVPAR